jgi:hypothetical protein
MAMDALRMQAVVPASQHAAASGCCLHALLNTKTPACAASWLQVLMATRVTRVTEAVMAMTGRMVNILTAANLGVQQAQDPSGLPASHIL